MFIIENVKSTQKYKEKVLHTDICIFNKMEIILNISFYIQLFYHIISGLENSHI